MAILRFPGLAKSAAESNKDILQNITGYSLIRDGDDWIVPENDAKLISGPSDIIVYEDRHISLTKSNYGKISDLFISTYLVPELEGKVEIDKYGKITIDGNFDLLTDIYANKIEFFASKIGNNELRTCLTTKLLPFMQERMKARYIAPLKAEVRYQQSIISLSRLATSVDKYGIDYIKKRVDEKKIFDNLLPSPLNILSYVEAVLTFSPFAVTLPFNRIGSQLHFFNENLWVFSHIATENIYEMFLSDQDPLPITSNTDFLNLYNLGSFGGRKYFHIVVNGVNRLANFLNNPLNYVNSNGVIDNQKLLQSHSAFHLMFADLAAINYTNSKYCKTRFSFSYLDKLANIKANFLGIKDRQRDEQMFNRILSLEHGDKLSRMLKYHFGKEYDKLGTVIKNATQKAYSRIHQSLENSMDGEVSNENARLEILRSLRNTSHGSFLNRGQFDKVLYSDISVPFEITYLPLLLTLGLILDTKNFLEL